MELNGAQLRALDKVLETAEGDLDAAVQGWYGVDDPQQRAALRRWRRLIEKQTSKEGDEHASTETEAE